LINHSESFFAGQHWDNRLDHEDAQFPARLPALKLLEVLRMCLVVSRHDDLLVG
jgi:hypothetical protein